MARTFVNRASDSDPIPFLRGILTQSLQEAGLSFDAAYQVATEVRDALRDVEEVTPDEIRDLVLPLLERHDERVRLRYERMRSGLQPILVRYPDGQTHHFSRGRHRIALAPCGLEAEHRAQIVEDIHDRLRRRSTAEIGTAELGRLTYDLLKEEGGKEAARRYAVWEEFQRADRPLLLLIGGATAVGKSTMATEISRRLDIVRAQSTDMLREVMRMMIPQRLMPILHVSSFLAWEAVPAMCPPPEGPEALVATGYLTQSEMLGVACAAVVQRALHERVSMILEGVHVHPGITEALPKKTDAIIVPLMLAVLDPDMLKRRLRGRGKRAPGRRAKRYLKSFDSIWSLQSFLLSEADAAGVPIVANDTEEKTVEEVMSIVMAKVSRHYEGDPSDAFA
jgi:2-phosphoglycerate kinase